MALKRKRPPKNKVNKSLAESLVAAAVFLFLTAEGSQQNIEKKKEFLWAAAAIKSLKKKTDKN